MLLKNVWQIQAAQFAFAAILADGSAVIWGDVDLGGDSSTVQRQLKNVPQIQASFGAFAAIFADGSVVTWGDDPSSSRCFCCRSCRRMSWPGVMMTMVVTVVWCRIS